MPLLPILFQHFVLSFFLMSQISDGCSKVRPAVLWKFYMSFCALPRARIATLIMSEVIIFASVAIYGNNQKVNQISKLISMVLTVILNYIISKLFIFNDRKELINENK